MEISRGVHTCGLRIRLTLQSEDVETHAAMTDALEAMKSAADVAAHEARIRIRQRLRGDKGGTVRDAEEVGPPIKEKEKIQK